MTLIEVVVAFTVLMVALVPLSYLFTSAVIQAGQSTNQQTALSIAERWAETLSNTTPPVTASTGAVIVDTQEPPAGPAATFTPPTVTAASNNKALNTVTTINVTSTANFAAASAAVPQTAYVITGTAPNTVSNQITYTSMTATSLTCPTTCSTSSNVMATGNPVTQTEISTPTEVRGGTTYTLRSEYEWATTQNTGVVSTPIAAASIGAALPQSTIYLGSVSNLLSASSSNPQTLKVPTTKGTQTVTYTGLQTSPAAITGVSGGTGTITSGNASQVPKPNLCTSGTPQLLKLTVSVSWGPNADVNNVQDSVMLNYPPAGVQTLGFVALQFTGDSGATDAQGNPWSERVTAIPVTLTGPENITIYPDEYGCAFAQVLPGNYTVTVANATSGIPIGSNYGSPSFVANTTGSYSNSVWSPPTTEPQGGTPNVNVSIGAVTRIDTQYAANYPSYDQAATVNFSYPSTTAVEDGVVCPASGQVTCIASGESSASNGADLNWLNASNGTWSTVGLPNGANVTRVTSIACAGATACIGVGYGTGGAVILHGTTGASPSVSLDSLGGVAGMSASPAQLTQVTCPTATQCVAVGTNSTGSGVVLAGTVGAGAGSDTWTAATLPANVTSLSSLQCFAASSGCVALATTTTVGSPVIVSGPVTGGTWAVGSFTGFTVSSLSQATCPTTTSCLAIGTGKIGAGSTGPLVLSGVVTGGTGIGSPGSSVAWTADTLNPSTTTLTSLSSIVCPVTSPAVKCLVSGTGTSGTTTGALFLYGPPAGPLSVEFPQASGSPVSSIGQVTCPSATQCVAIGLSSSTPVIFTGAINGSGADTWTSDAVPSTAGTVTALTQVVCPAASNCLIAANGSSPAGYLFSTSNGSTWTNANLPASDAMLYFSGLACTAGASGTCSAVGASRTGAVVLTSKAGPTGSWSDTAPSNLGGYSTAGIPIEINNANLAPSPYVNAVQAGSATTVTQLPLLFPFQGGYSLWAGDCQAEGANSYAGTQVATIPGGISGVTPGMPVSVVPLGVLGLQVTHRNGSSAGLAYAGATASLTATTAGCNADSYSLQTTGADGASRTEVPFGSYTLTVAGSAAGTLVVAANSVTFTPSGGSAATYQLPALVQVSA